MQERVIALGLFDGVHLGHAALLRKARETADRLRLPAAALTFDPPPALLVTGRAPKLINTLEDRKDMIRRLCRIDEVLVSGFNQAMAEMNWRDYVEYFLVKRLGAVHLVCGPNHRFGWRGEGTAGRLRMLCGEIGVGCDIVPEVAQGGLPVSSTRVRSLLGEGDLDGAISLLGHPHILSGTVVHGRKLGTALGTPTANIPLPDGVICPVFGVYACRVITGGKTYPAVCNVGVRPTVEGSRRISCESWLLDFSGNLYGKTIRVEFHKFLRPERKFPSLEALKAAILRDAGETRDYFTILENFEAYFDKNVLTW